MGPFTASLLRWLTRRRVVLHGLGQAARPPGDVDLDREVAALPAEDEVARHAERALEALPLADLDAFVAQVWADAGAKLRDLAPYDRDAAAGLRGLVRDDGQPKPALEALQRWNAESSHRRLGTDDAETAPAAGPSADAWMAAMGVPDAPRPRTSALLALPGGPEFERMAQDLGLKPGRPQDAGRPRGAPPRWADVEPAEVESQPDVHVPRLYKRFRDAGD